MKIVFMGSAEFGIPALATLFERHEVAAVVSTPARPRGRGLKLIDSPITQYAKERGMGTILTPEDLREEGFINELKKIDADIFVVVAFRILHRDVYSIPKFGTVNIHASLLPKYRGAAPIQRAIEAGERETGVTVFRIDDGIDTGEIINQKKVSIGGSETTPELYERLSVLGAEALLEALDKLDRGDAGTIAQNGGSASRAPKLSRAEGHIDWSLPSTAIFNKIRAFKPFPGTYFFMGGKRINIDWALPVDRAMSMSINTLPEGEGGGMVRAGAVLSAAGGHIDVMCGDGNIIRVTKVRPEGRPSMDVKAFLLGHKITEGTVLE